MQGLSMSAGRRGASHTNRVLEHRLDDNGAVMLRDHRQILLDACSRGGKGVL